MLTAYFLTTSAKDPLLQPFFGNEITLVDPKG